VRVWSSHSNDGIGIPYPPAKRDDGSQCHGYFDLKSDPPLVDEIAELKREPELKMLVKTINSEGPYKTAGCLAWTCNSGPGEPRRRKAGSYVTVCFADASRNSSEAIFKKMCEDFGCFVADQPVETVGVEFSIGPATFRDHNDLSGWVVAIFVYGYGATGIDAKKSWRQGIRALNAFFEKRAGV
jgi:hypothetical protein